MLNSERSDFHKKGFNVINLFWFEQENNGVKICYGKSESLQDCINKLHYSHLF